MTNQERIKKIDKLIEKWVKIIEQNPTITIDKDFIYHLLIYEDVEKKDKMVDLSIDSLQNRLSNIMFPNKKKNEESSVFSKWIRRYENSNTKCFVSPDWEYFCQFISKDKKAYRSNEHIKMYIPLDASHIENGVEMIFDFLDKENISHISKVGKKIRFDDVVVRLVNVGDANKLLDYIESNKYIQSGLISPNPFAYNEGNIALAVDGSLSYNSTVARLMADYLRQSKNQNMLKDACAEGFYGYINKLYKMQFMTHESDYLKNLFNWEDYEELNYREVVALIIKSRGQSFDYGTLIDHYDNCIGINKYEDPKEKATNDLLIESLIAMTKRFNSNGIPNVQAYYETGAGKFITSQNDLRKRIIESNFRENLRDILKKENKSFIVYAMDLLKKNNIDLDSYLEQKRL